MKKSFIYELSKNGVPFYIGKTVNINQRKLKHQKNYGSDILMISIDEVIDWVYWESYYIELYRSWGFNLINKVVPRNGLMCHSNETRKKISDKLKEKYKDPNYKPMKDFKHTEESKKRMSEMRLGPNGSFYGRKHSKETLGLLREIGKRSMTPELLASFSHPIIVDGVEYSSIRECSRQLGYSRKYISRRLNSNKFPNFIRK